MAKKFVTISLGTKLRLVFGAAVLVIIGAALVVPWLFIGKLAEQGLEQPAAEVTRLRLNEFLLGHDKRADRATVSSFYTAGRESSARTGPTLIRLSADMKATPPLDLLGQDALKAFLRSPSQEVAVLKGQDDQGQAMYRGFRAIRAEQTCMECHGPEMVDVKRQYQLGALVGMVDVGMPQAMASGELMRWTQVSFIGGGVLASLLALMLFWLITQRLILRPLRHLRDISDKVAEGDLTVRSTVRTGDELQRLGDSFNEMLAAIADQHTRLRAANRALDLRLNELAEANVTLFRANRVKSEFLTNISHELRTPLNSIIGFADLLRESADARIQRYGENISTAAKNLLAMINDLLDLAKIEAGKADVRPDKVSVTGTCQTLLALVRPLADKKHLSLYEELLHDLPVVITDGGKLQQILYNLLSNAVKFTPAHGKVTLSTSCDEIQRDGTIVRQVRVSVADTGPGIPEVEQQHIFEKFYQVDRSLTKESAGTGLGLAISKELAALLGGRLTLKSSPGHGATFSLHLPVDGPDGPSQ